MAQWGVPSRFAITVGSLGRRVLPLPHLELDAAVDQALHQVRAARDARRENPTLALKLVSIEAERHRGLDCHPRGLEVPISSDEAALHRVAARALRPEVERHPRIIERLQRWPLSLL